MLHACHGCTLRALVRSTQTCRPLRVQGQEPWALYLGGTRNGGRGRWDGSWRAGEPVGAGGQRHTHVVQWRVGPPLGDGGAGWSTWHSEQRGRASRSRGRGESPRDALTVARRAVDGAGMTTGKRHRPLLSERQRAWGERARAFELRHQHGLFVLVRDIDVSGVSGTGVIAEGVQFSNGVAVMQWVTTYQSTVVWPGGVEELIKVHGHDGATRVEWR